MVVQNGVVRLTGTVPTGAQRLEAQSSHVRFRACAPSRTTSASQPPRTNRACAPRQQEAPAHAGGRDRRSTCAAQARPHRHAA